MSDTQTAPVADTRSASQRIEDLENGVMAAFQTMDSMTRDILTIKEAIKLLANKTDSIVKATQRGEPLNDEVLSKIMIENNARELKDKVSAMVQQGILVKGETVEDSSFLVCRELNAQSELINPRLQFALQALVEDTRGKLKGAKVGDVIDIQEGLKLEIMETYDVRAPSAPITAAVTPAMPEPVAPTDTGAVNA